MTPDQISKLPPAIKLVADDLRHAGCLGEDDSYRLLTWGLQMQEANARAVDDCLAFAKESNAHIATIATLRREKNEALASLKEAQRALNDVVERHAALSHTPEGRGQ